MTSNKITYQELEKKNRELEIENQHLKSKLSNFNNKYAANENDLVGADGKGKENEAIYKTLVENTPDIIARFDRNLRHVFINSIYEKITGFSIKDVLGKTHREIGSLDEETIIYSENIIKLIFENKKKH